MLLPNSCYCCGRDLPFREEGALCAACRANVIAVGTRCCQRCGKPLPDGGAHCYHCRGSKAGKYRCQIIRSALVFGPQVRAVVHAFKYASRTHLAEELANYMAAQWPLYPQLAQAQVLVAVPLHRKKRRSRGYNQSELLAQALGRRLHLPVDNALLERVRNTPSQTEFGREGRLQNMQGAFACRLPQRVKGKTVLLIDDVATTGATLEGCAEALKSVGARRVMAYTLAREK